MNRLPDAVLFDLDGTLVDSESTHAESIARVLADYGVELGDEDRLFVVGHAWQEIYERLRVAERTPLGLPELQAAAVEAKERMFAGGMRLEPLGGARELIDLVDGLGIPAAIASGSCRAEIEQTLRAIGLAGRFRFYVGAEDYAHGKPAPDSYLLAAARLRVAPEHCLVFEDSTAGIGAARAANMRVIATRACYLGLPPGVRQDQSGAHRVVDGLEGLTERDLRAIMEA
jgi:HAD superfamily hydrolase (TIGR01509 family)